MPDLLTSPVLHPHPNPYEPAVCPLPRCSEDLHLHYEAGGPVHASDTADELGLILASPTWVSWKVECLAGHVLLLPTDGTDADARVFGRCDCSDFEDEGQHHELCGVFDLDRLRSVSGVGKVDGDPF